MTQSEIETNIRVRFAEHILNAERVRVLADLEDEMGTTQAGVEGDWVLLRLGRLARVEYVFQLLTDEAKAGRLVWERTQ